MTREAIDLPLAPGDSALSATKASAPGRTTRVAQALTIGYGYQAVVAITGLVLTPFLLVRLGDADYGRWLVVGQVLALLGLLDLGVAAALPREVARASGSNGADAVRTVVRRAVWLVGFQTPAVGAASFVVWLFVSSTRPELAGPLFLILAGFVIQFPLRVPAAVLAGLQDAVYGGVIQAATWSVATVLSVVLVLAGWGLYALAGGWVAGQIVGCSIAWLRLRSRFPEARIQRGWPGRRGLGTQLRASIWTSLAQLSQIMVNGTDLLLIAWLLGPEAAVVYSCTTKLIGVFSNQCYVIGMASQPGLAQLRGSENHEQLRVAIRAMMLVLLTASGAVAIGATAANGAFVTVWVGAAQYAGAEVTLLAVAATLVRHAAFACWNSAYTMGYERRIALTLFADGLTTMAATVGWTALLGLPGVPLGSLTSSLFLYLPLALISLAAGLEIPPVRVLGWIAPWAARFAAVFAPIAVVSFVPAATSARFAAPLAVVGSAFYALLMYRLASREPLRGYRDRLIWSASRFFLRHPVATPPKPVSSS